MREACGFRLSGDAEAAKRDQEQRREDAAGEDYEDVDDEDDEGGFSDDG